MIALSITTVLPNTDVATLIKGSFLGDYIVPIVLGTIFILSYFVEISKIKFNPLSSLFGIIGRAIYKPVAKTFEGVDLRLTDFERELKRIAHKIDTNEMLRLRGVILEFATSCKRGDDHNEEQFKYIISVHDDYERLIEAIKLVDPSFKNGVVDNDYNYILDVYMTCAKKGVFCQGGSCKDRRVNEEVSINV